MNLTPRRDFQDDENQASPRQLTWYAAQSRPHGEKIALIPLKSQDYEALGPLHREPKHREHSAMAFATDGSRLYFHGI